MNARRRRAKSVKAGFTLVEIMTVVVIVGLLASLAVPALLRAQNRSRAASFVNDIRVIAHAAEQYASVKGEWPPDGSAEIAPELLEYLPKALSNPARTNLGGIWDWENGQFGVTAAISVHEPTASSAQLELVDEIIDDGNLATGMFRARTSGYMLVLQP